MSWLTRLRNVVRSDKVSDEIDREMKFHLAERADQLEADGFAPDDARDEARRRFGNYTIQKERTRDFDVLLGLESLASDIRHAVRALRASPGFTLVVSLSLALGIGANTAIFTLINVAMLKSLPVNRPDELVQLRLGLASPGTKAPAFSRALWEQLRDRQDVFAGMLMYGATNADASSGGEARRLNVGLVNGDFFSVLGVRAAAGRTFTAADDFPGCPAVAVVSHSFWQREFGGRADLGGTSIPLNGQPFQVIGVTEPAFFGIEFGWEMSIWIPQCAERSANGGGGAGGALVLARMKRGVTVEESHATLSALAPAMLDATVPVNATAQAAARYRASSINVEPFSGGLPFLRDRYGDALWILMAIAGVVLIVACANIANLLLARAAARRREVAVRLALGASRLRLIRQWLTESLLLTLAGSAIGVLLAYWGSRGLVTMLSANIAVDLRPDATVLVFTTVVGILTGVIFGLIPAFTLRASSRRARRDRSLESLVGTGHRVAYGDTRFRTGKTLVVGQLALSLAMVTAAGLLVGSWGRLLQIDPGFRSENVLLVGINTGPARLPPDQRGDTYRRILERLRAIPGVSDASAAWITPLGQNADVVVDATGFASVAVSPVQARLNQVSGGYFRTIGTALLAGRDFRPEDSLTSPWVAIVNEELARRVYGTANVVGQHFRVPQNRGLSEPIEIVGVVGNTKWNALREQDQPIVYYALSQMSQPGPGMNFALRVAGAESTVAAEVRSVMADIDPWISLTLVSLTDRLHDSIRQPRTLAVLAGFFGGLALLLAIIGLYGMLSYTVGRRRNELAVRLALGAPHRRLIGMVVGETARLVIIGVGLGLAISVGGTRLVSSFLYGVTPRDPATFALSAALLVAVALTAALIPARRAARLDPVAALREE
jgi:putative ABC transport system permease protein